MYCIMLYTVVSFRAALIAGAEEQLREEVPSSAQPFRQALLESQRASVGVAPVPFGVFTSCATEDCDNGAQGVCGGCGRSVCGECMSSACTHACPVGASSSSSSSSSSSATATAWRRRGAMTAKRSRAADDDDAGEDDENEGEDRTPAPSSAYPLSFAVRDPHEIYKLIAYLLDGEKNQMAALTGDALQNVEGLAGRAERKKQDAVFAKGPGGCTGLFAIPDAASSHSMVHAYYHTEQFNGDEPAVLPEGKSWIELDKVLKDYLTRPSYDTFHRVICYWTGAMAKSYTATVTTDAFHTGGFCRRELLSDYLNGKIPNPCDAKFFLSKCPKWKDTNEVDAAWLLERLPIFKGIMGKEGYVPEDDLTEVLDDDRHGWRRGEVGRIPAENSSPITERLGYQPSAVCHSQSALPPGARGQASCQSSKVRGGSAGA